MRGLARVLILVFCFALSVGAQPASTSAFVGSNVCRACHPDVWLNFYKNPHYRSIASGKEPPERTGCESCHGPGQAHIQARGGKATIVAFSQLQPKAVLENCLRCHSSTVSMKVSWFARTAITRTAHSRPPGGWRLVRAWWTKH